MLFAYLYYFAGDQNPAQCGRTKEAQVKLIFHYYGSHSGGAE